MNRLAYVMTLLACLLACPTWAADEVPKLVGIWHNGMCSEMEVKSLDAKTGMISGTYRTGVGQPDPGDLYPLTGYLYGDLLGFSVNWGAPIGNGKAVPSITSWTGQHTKVAGEDILKTFWNIAVNVPDKDEPEELWAGIWSGGDTFKPGPVPKGCKPQS